MRLNVVVLAAALLLPVSLAARTHPPQLRLVPGGYRWTARRVSHMLHRPLTKPERKAMWRAKMNTKGELGHDGATRCRVFNYTFRQLKRKLKVLRAASFTRLERRRLIMSGLLDYHFP